MLSHAQFGRSRVISCHMQDIGGYQSTVDYICYREKEPWSNINGDRMKSMCRLTHVISSMPIKDCIVVGTSDKIERMSITQLAG